MDMEIVEDVNLLDSPKSESSEFEVLKITSRKESADGLEHLYEVHWKDGDTTFEPVSNLSGASDALRSFLEDHYPNDTLLKVLSSLAESSEEEGEHGLGNGVDKMSWLARWHQKTTRGSTQYWLRKGEDGGGTVSSLLQKGVIGTEKPTDAPLAPTTVPDAPPTPGDVPGILFSEGEDTPGTPGQKIRKRIRIMEETVKMFPHEELYGAELERNQSKILALWKRILTFVLLAIPVGVFVFLYFNKPTTTTIKEPAAGTTPS